MILTPLILEYMRRKPQMAVEIVTEGALVDVNAKGFDGGIRIREAVPPTWSSFRSATASVRPSSVRSEYFRQHGKPQVPADLQNHECIRARMASGTLYRWEFEKRGESFTLDVPGKLTLDDSDLMLRAAGTERTFLSE